MAGATIPGTTSNQYIDSRIVWSSTTNTTANTSSVTASLQYKRNNTGFTTTGTGSFSITINNQKTSATKAVAFSEGGWVTAVSATVTVSHDSDGTKSIFISSTGSIPNTTLTATYCGGTATLDTIPRAATITSVADATLGNKCSVKWSVPTVDFRYRLKFSLEKWSYTTPLIQHDAKTSTHTYTGYTFPVEEVSKQILTSKTATMTVTLYTYSDSAGTVQVGSESSKTFTVTVPNNASTQPTVEMSLSPVHSFDDENGTFSAVYIQGLSKVKATITAEGQHDATISKRVLSVSGKKVASPYLLTQTGYVAVKCTATDSRGISNSVTENITVIPYSKPSVLPIKGQSAVVCVRCDENGNPKDDGDSIKICAKRSYSKVVASDGKQKNRCVLGLRYKEQSSTNYTEERTLLARDYTSSDEYDKVLLTVSLDSKTSYNFQVYVRDDIGNEDAYTFYISAGSVTFNAKEGGKGFAFGKYSERDNCLEITEGWDVVGRVYGLGKAKDVVQSNTSMAEYKAFGVYAVETDAIASTLQDLPTDKAGTLVVSSANGTGKTVGNKTYILQEYTEYTGKNRYRRVLRYDDSTGWTPGDWVTEGDSGWISLGLNDEEVTGDTSSTSAYGRNGIGCYYRVVNGNHVYIAFNGAFTYRSGQVRVNANRIPLKYCSPRTVFSLCCVGGRHIARVFVEKVGTEGGDVVVEWVQSLTEAGSTTTKGVDWIDGYIDYWI